MAARKLAAAPPPDSVQLPHFELPHPFMQSDPLPASQSGLPPPPKLASQPALQPASQPGARPAPTRIVIASRESRLALWQAGHVRGRLRALFPDCEVVIEGMTTRGDRIVDRSLSKIGGKGLFVKELEAALLAGSCDLAVHSLKDVPMTLEPELALAAILEREDARDAFVSNRYASLAELPRGAVVGTSSLRREAQLRARYPHLVVEPLRGNLDTRLAKLDTRGFDAIILAAAGLKRLGLDARIRGLIDPDDSLPAPGQGALAIEILAGRADLSDWLAPLHDAPTAACVAAERAVSRALGGNCDMPLGAYATLQIAGTQKQLRLRALVARRDGSATAFGEDALTIDAALAAPSDAACEALGASVGAKLIEQGALALAEAERKP
jgi:hydroxymethylbilane synthase